MENLLAYAVTQIFLIFRLARIGKCRTAILLSGGLNCDARKSSPRNNQTAAAPKRRPAVAAPTSLGLRCDQRQIRAGGETGRATIGRPPSQRSRSAARSPADW